MGVVQSHLVMVKILPACFQWRASSNLCPPGCFTHTQTPQPPTTAYLSFVISSMILLARVHFFLSITSTFLYCLPHNAGLLSHHFIVKNFFFIPLRDLLNFPNALLGARVLNCRDTECTLFSRERGKSPLIAALCSPKCSTSFIFFPSDFCFVVYVCIICPRYIVFSALKCLVSSHHLFFCHLSD